MPGTERETLCRGNKIIMLWERDLKTWEQDKNTYVPFVFPLHMQYKVTKPSCAGPYYGEYVTTISRLISLVQVNMLYLLLSTGSTQKTRPDMTETLLNQTKQRNKEVNM